MSRAAAWWTLAGILVAAGFVVATWGPKDLTKTYKYGLATAIILWLMAAALIGLGAWTVRGKRDETAVEDAQTQRDIARAEARDARSNFNALRAKEEELTRVLAEIGQLNGATMLTSMSSFTGAGGKLRALEERKRELKEEIRRLGG